MTGLHRNYPIQCLDPCLHPIQSLGRSLVRIKSSAGNDQSLLPAFFYFFHFRGLENVKQNEEMKQNAVKHLAVGTVLQFKIWAQIENVLCVKFEADSVLIVEGKYTKMQLKNLSKL